MAKTKSRQINELVISLSKKAQKVLKNKKSTLKEKQQNLENVFHQLTQNQ